MFILEQRQWETDQVQGPPPPPAPAPSPNSKALLLAAEGRCEGASPAQPAPGPGPGTQVWGTVWVSVRLHGEEQAVSISMGAGPTRVVTGGSLAVP